MRFRVVNREEACRWNPVGEPHVIISIHSPPDEKAAVKENEFTRAVLHLGFHDLDQEPGFSWRKVYGEPIMFTPAMAQEIADFVAGHYHEISVIVVHCDAGHSRSPAVAAALAYRYDELETSNWFFEHRCPNRLVHRMLLNVLMDEGTRRIS